MLHVMYSTPCITLVHCPVHQEQTRRLWSSHACFMNNKPLLHQLAHHIHSIDNSFKTLINQKSVYRFTHSLTQSIIADWFSSGQGEHLIVRTFSRECYWTSEKSRCYKLQWPAHTHNWNIARVFDAPRHG